MFGVGMFIEMESFSESKQTSGYGVDLQRDLKEDKWESRGVVVVVVEAVAQGEEEFRAQSVQSNKNDLIITEEAMRGIKLARKVREKLRTLYQHMNT